MTHDFLVNCINLSELSRLYFRAIVLRSIYSLLIKFVELCRISVVSRYLLFFISRSVITGGKEYRIYC